MDVAKAWHTFTHEYENWPEHRAELLKGASSQHNYVIRLLDEIENKLITLEVAAKIYGSLVLDLHVLTEKSPPCSLAEKALSLEKRINSISQSLKNSWQIGKAESQSNTPCPISVTTSESSLSPDTSPESSSCTSEPTRTIPRYSNTTQKETSPTSPPSKEHITCMNCKGTGEIKDTIDGDGSRCMACSGKGYHDFTCTRCKGYGSIDGATCSYCGGLGHYNSV